MRRRLALGKVAAQRHHEIADGEQAEAGRDHDRHRLRPDAVGRGDLQRRHVPDDDAGEHGEQRRDDDAGGVDAPVLRLHDVSPDALVMPALSRHPRLALSRGLSPALRA